MEDLVFQHDETVGGEIFTLEAERVVITTPPLGKMAEKVFRLTNLSPECEVRVRRVKALYWVPGVMAVILLIATYQLYLIAIRVSYDLWFLPGITAFAMVGLFYNAIKGYKSREVTRFRDTKGNVAFELFETKSTRFTYADFVAELKKRINQRAWR